MIISMKGVKLDEKLSFLLLNPSKEANYHKIAEEPSILLNSLSSLTIERYRTYAKI